MDIHKRATEMAMRDRLLAWLEDPDGTEESLYIDTLSALVEELLDEQRNYCANAAFRICGDDQVAQACLDAREND